MAELTELRYLATILYFTSQTISFQTYVDRCWLVVTLATDLRLQHNVTLFILYANQDMPADTVTRLSSHSSGKTRKEE